jgi:hypothetical protein
MNWNSPLGISLFLAFSTGVLSLAQAWVLGSPGGRWPRYLIALLGGAALMAWAGGLVVDVGSGDGALRDHVRLALFLSGLVIAGLALSTRFPVTTPEESSCPRKPRPRVAPAPPVRRWTAKRSSDC